MAQSRAKIQAVESHLSKILNSKDFPAFAEHVAEVQKAASDEQSSIRHITNVILKDVSLTMKVLRTANSAQYNRSGRGLVTVTHAVALLGLDAIRDMASGTLLFQHFWGKSPHQKQLLQLSLLTASHARATGKRINYPQIEEAYLCGMFRNLGEILVAGYMPRKYTAILRRMNGFEADPADACQRVLECTFEDLGQAASRHWKMPDRVRHAMQAPPAQDKRVLISELDALRAITSFSHGLTEAIHRGEPEKAGQKLHSLLSLFGGALKLNRDNIQEIASEAIEETQSTFETLSIPLDHLRLRNQMDAAMQALDAGWEEEAGLVSSDAEEPGEALLERLTEEVELVLCSDTTCDLNRVLLMVMEAIYRGAPFDRVVFGLVSPDRRLVRGRLGLGEGVEPLVAGFQFPLSIRSGPLAVALLGKQDSFIRDERYSHTPFGELVDSSNYGIMPLVVDGAAVGVFYFDRKDDQPPSPGLVYQLSRLRSLATEAFQIYRTNAVGAA
ncbi:MAG: HDOD domain-containing protein [bacterium]|nr:HDOD domain-containing protein [bacterium]